METSKFYKSKKGGAIPCTTTSCPPIFIREWEFFIIAIIIVVFIVWMFYSESIKSKIQIYFKEVQPEKFEPSRAFLNVVDDRPGSTYSGIRPSFAPNLGAMNNVLREKMIGLQKLDELADREKNSENRVKISDEALIRASM